MNIDPATETRVFGRLVMRGVLSRESVQALFDRAKADGAAGKSVSLAALAVDEGLLEPSQIATYLRTDGDDVPDLPGYSYQSKLGEGGTASVFAVAKRGGDVQAVKILHAHMQGDAFQVKCFLAEAKLLGRLDHPNVVKGYQAGRFGGRYLSFMEHIEGTTLQDALADGGVFEEDIALKVILQVARALDYLRSQGIVHRDIKPGNILITGEHEVKVIDLGFAMAEDGAAGDGATTIGTAAFLSPEQAQGQADLDVRSDIYALGATLYQLVLGELPFSGDDEELVQKAVLEGLSASATKGGRISAPMHYFIEKMMAKDRDHRYQDPQQLIADIERQVEGRRTMEHPGDDSVEEKDAMLQKRLKRMRKRRGKR